MTHDAPEAPDTGRGLPYAARLGLDELLEQLVSRAQQVQNTQGRLRGLLRAYLAVARADDLDVVLRHVIEAARQLVDARYAALGITAHGRLVRFIHTGMSEDVVAGIDHLPEGKGLLGLLVDYPQTLRLREIAGHVASIGFPDNHPPMRSFLGVPIRIGDRVFGNLYLTDKHGSAEFASDDEEVVKALAAAAAVAIENATVLAESRRRQAWQAAMMQLTLGLVGGEDPSETLARLVDHACEVLGADGAGINTPTEDPKLWRLAVTSGSFTPWLGAPIPLENSMSAAAIEAGDLLTITDPGADTRTVGSSYHNVWAMFGDTLAVPLRGEHGVPGVLVVARRFGDVPFDAVDRDLMRSIAAHAGLALELAEIRRQHEHTRRMDDRGRIAEDLRQRVIQRLSRHGLTLQGISGRVGRPASAAVAIRAQVDEVDAIIYDLRAAIFTIDASQPNADGS